MPLPVDDDLSEGIEYSDASESHEIPPANSEVEELAEDIENLVNLDDERDNSCTDNLEIEKDILLANLAKEEGNGYFRTKDYDSAIASYSRAVVLCPTDDEHKENLSVFLGNRAAAYFSVDEYECVVDDCTSSLELKADYVKVLMRRSQAYEKLTRPEDALVGMIFMCAPYDIPLCQYHFYTSSSP